MRNKQLHTIFCLLLFLAGTLLYAQLQWNHWYFGRNAGVDFTSGTPIAVTNGQLNTLEGCTAISDEYGNLLFYSDGRRIWNRNHNVMPNGNGLLGNESSTQSGIVLPHPNDCNLYYLFVIGAIYENPGIHYSVVDMSLNNGNGAVIPAQKNIPLLLNGQLAGHEKLTAVVNADRTGYWLLTHYENNFYAFSITEEINTTPVVSPVEINSQNYGVGYLKASPDGSRLAMAYAGASIAQEGALSIYDFDLTSGIVSNEIILDSRESEIKRGYYGVEFSPNSQVLYAAPYNQYISQYDLNAPSIEDSEYAYYFSKGAEIALQLAPDGNIYHPITSSSFYLGRIENTNTVYNPDTGEGPVFVQNALFLQNRRSGLGLPQFLNFYFRISPMINGVSNTGVYCMSTELNFDFCSQGGIITSFHWDFGDGTTSTEQNPVHTYEDSGTYVVTLTLTVDGEEITRIIEFEILPFPTVEDAVLEACFSNGDEVVFDLTEAYPQINPGGESVTITFHATPEEAENGDTPLPAEYPANAETTLFVRVENDDGCYLITELELIFSPELEITTQSPVEICYGESAVLSVTTEAGIVRWYYNGYDEEPFDSGHSIEVTDILETTTFWVEVVNTTETGLECQSERLPYEVIVNPLPELLIENANPQICFGESILLTVESVGNTVVNWYFTEEGETPDFTGESFETPNLTQTTSYWIEAISEAGCLSERQEIVVTVNLLPELTIEDTDAVCIGSTVILEAVSEGNTINWYLTVDATEPIETGNSYQTEELFTNTSFWVEAISIENCQSDRIEIQVIVHDEIEPEFTQIATICAGETLEELPTESENGITGTWSPALDNTETTTYTFTPDAGQCASPYEMTITVNFLPELTIETPTVIICAGETAALSVVSNAQTVNWYETETSEIIIDTGSTMTTQPLFTTTSFWVETINEEGCIAERQEIVVTVNQLPELTFETENLEICIGNSIEITVSTNIGIVNWYLTEEETEPFYTGNIFVTPELIENTSFWVEAVSDENCQSGRIEIPVIVTDEIEPEFIQITPVCEGTVIELPTESENGITGTWFPEFNPEETTEYTFTPDEGQCAIPYAMTIVVNQETIPEFTPIAPVCEGTEFTLPTESENGITGTWFPAPNLTQTETYTFTPDAGFCATTYEMLIVVNEEIIPVFDPIDPICAETEFTLPTESLNGITGTWFPALNYTETTEYTFTPDAGFCATTQTLTVTVNPIPEVQDDIIYFCDSLNNGFEEVDLTLNNITNDSDVILEYYFDEYYESPIGNPANFLIESSPGVVYVSAAAGNGCLAYAELTVILTGAPAVSDTSLEICSTDGRGIYQLTDANESIIPNPTNYTITYHVSYEDAKDGINPLDDETYENQTTNQTVFARVEEGENCFNIAEVRLTYNNTFDTITPLEECDDNSDGLAIFNLTEKEPDISAVFGGSGYTIIYYTSLENAYDNVDEIPNPESFSNETNPQTVYAKVLDGDICLGIVAFDLIAVQIPEIEVPELITLCPGEEETVSVLWGFATYTWTNPNGIVISTTNSAMLDTEGIYVLEITFDYNICFFIEEIEVVFDDSPVVTNIEVNGNTIIVTASGTPPLEYSIDNGVTWQSSNIFYDVPYGNYHVIVRNANGCESGVYPVVVFELTNIITPNNDGHNDTWEIPTLVNYPGATLKIVDRYGKTLVNTNLETGFIWDGKHNGNPLHSTSYWYVLDLGNGQKITGNVTIKNY